MPPLWKISLWNFGHFTNTKIHCEWTNCEMETSRQWNCIKSKCQTEKSSKMKRRKGQWNKSLVEITGVSKCIRTVCWEDSTVVQSLTNRKLLPRMHSVDCNGAMLTVIGLLTCGKMFFGVLNLLQSGSPMDVSGIGGSRYDWLSSLMVAASWFRDVFHVLVWVL